MKVLTFRLNGELFGIDVASVKEINRNVRCTQVPTSEPHIVGLYNMRGQVVTVYNLARIFGFESEKKDLMNCVILKNHNAPDVIGFCVDVAEDVLNIDKAKLKPPPENVERGVRENLAGVYETDEELLLLIDERGIRR